VRAGRLIAMLIALQREGRMTAGQLADELEVSIRTVLRDVEALSEAGVPIYATQGAGGGIELVDGFQARLTGLTADDAPGLLLAGAPALAATLGLDRAAGSARGKLLQELPARLREAATGVDAWFLHDVRFERTPAAVVRTVAAALRDGVQVVLDPGGPAATADAGRPALHPLGLVLSDGRWWLLHLADHGPAARPLPGVGGARVVPRPAPRPDGFDLAREWGRLRPAAADRDPG
jgi:predicted DNA-binding transcriptional regulator YafY